MKSVLFAALVAAPAFCCAQNLAEASASSATGATALDAVIVTATRTPQRQSESTAATIVIDRAQIEAAQAGDIAELLRFNAGFDLGRSGGPGQQTSVFVRGGESNHTLVLIDGVRVNPATSGGAALQNLSPDMIERIEIVKGPRSTLYGSDALSAVINIITRNPEGRQIEASIRGGSYGTVDGSARYAEKIGAYGFSVQTEQQRSDGFPTCAGATRNSAFRNNSVNLKGSADLGVVRLEARAWNAQGKTEYLDFCDPTFGFNPTAQAFRNQTLAFAATTRLLANWDSTLTLSRGEDRIEQYDLDASFTPPAHDLIRTVRPAIDWQNAIAIGRNFGVLFGANAAQERVDSLSFGSTIAQRIDLYNAFLQGKYDDGHNHAVLAGSLLHHEAFGSRFTWNAEYGYDLYQRARYKTTVIAATGTGFRAPDATDRYGFGGNPNLKPEQARNYEVGLRQIWGEHQTWDLRAFRSSLSNLISVVFDPTLPANDPQFGFRAVNIDRARTEGVELTYRYEDALWSGRLAGIIQNPKDRSDDSQLLRRARRTVTAQLTRRLGRFYVAADVLGTSDRNDFGGKDSGYTLLNLGAGWQITQAWSLSTRVENLLDRDYQTAHGYRQAGLSAYGTLRYEVSSKH
ncbi:MAG: TonB-dependent vitamin B12 receptor [Nevskia sp.]